MHRPMPIGCFNVLVDDSATTAVCIFAYRLTWLPHVHARLRVICDLRPTSTHDGAGDGYLYPQTRY